MQTYGLGPSSLFAIGLGTLVFITFLAGFIKVCFNKRTLRKKIEQAKIEEANKQTDLEKLVGERELDEGDLFGVRAIQAGFFGGVSQSCPNSPSISRSSSLNSVHPTIREKSQQEIMSHNLKIPKPTYGDSKSSTFTAAKRSPSSTSSSTSSRVKSSGSSNSEVFGTSPVINSELDQTHSDAQQKFPPSTETHADLITETSTATHEHLARNKSSISAIIPSEDALPEPLRVSPEYTRKGMRCDNKKNISASHSNLPRKLCPPAVIRDSIVSKQQVSISQPKLTVCHNSNSSSIYSAPSNVELASDQQLNLSHQLSTSSQIHNPSESVNPSIHKTSSAESQSKTKILVQSTNKSDHPLSQSQLCKGSLHSVNGEPKSISNNVELNKSSIPESEIALESERTAISAHGLESYESSVTSNPFAKSQRPISSRESIDDFYDTYYRQSTMRPGILDSDYDTNVGWRNKTPKWSPNGQDCTILERDQPNLPSNHIKDIFLELKSLDSNANGLDLTKS